MSDVLQNLQDELARELLRRVKSGEACSAADLAVARQLLRDNGIVSGHRNGQPITDLAAELPFEDDPTEEVAHRD